MNKLCLDNQLCFKLYALSRQVISQYRPLLDELDITYPQYLVLLVLWEEVSTSVKELGARLYLDSGTLTPLLKRLEQKQLIHRRRDEQDERSVIISLTGQGRSLQQRARKVPDALKCITLSREEQAQLKAQLDRLMAACTND